VVARLEIDVRRADQALIDDCFNAIRRAQRRDGSGLAVVEQFRKPVADRTYGRRGLRFDRRRQSIL
jgi:hypothetical protein